VNDRPERARLFVALDLPAGTRASLARWASRETEGRRDLRLLDAGMLHVTLCFLGWRDAAEAERIGELALACASPVAQLAAGTAAWLPPRRPRVLAVDLEDPRGHLAALQGRLCETLAEHAGYEPERRAFRPHVTVARVLRGARLRPFDLRPPPTDPFPGAALTLYRSHLGAGGPRYEAVAREAL
jgi:2'-5' RNA ligase